MIIKRTSHFNENPYERLHELSDEDIVDMIDRYNEGKIKTDTKTDMKIDVKIDVKTDAKTDVKTDVKTDTKTDVKADAKTDVKTDVKSAIYSPKDQNIESSSDDESEGTIICISDDDIDTDEEKNTAPLKHQTIESVHSSSLSPTIFFMKDPLSGMERANKKMRMSSPCEEPKSSDYELLSPALNPLKDIIMKSRKTTQISLRKSKEPSTPLPEAESSDDDLPSPGR